MSGPAPATISDDESRSLDALLGQGVAALRRCYLGPMRPSAEMLEPFIGQWVATKGPDVLVAAGDPRTVVDWLVEHRTRADSMFRVAADEFEACGLAPF